MSKYQAAVEIVLEVEFDDDGVLDLKDQAHEAAQELLDWQRVLHSRVLEVGSKP